MAVSSSVKTFSYGGGVGSLAMSILPSLYTDCWKKSLIYAVVFP